jgi:alkanesulfonate monooxygenase SsuD/methylene tetrahydromethanopterin reductase-like flavin-dependent oxidoreductase (luciferase family)
MAAPQVRFGVYVLQDAPFPILIERWRRAEELGFDQLWLADHSGDFRHLGGHWFDGWTTLAVMATVTTRIRIGMLVSNPILRHPALLAREAVAVDHLSGGRLELGIGTGIAGFDHAAMGSAYWPPRERATRFAEYVEVVDGLLRRPPRSEPFAGRYYRAGGAPIVPSPVQHPRPPITVGGQSPTVRRVAAAHADCWNTHGPFDRSAAEILEITRRQNHELDELCAATGRNPAELRRSLLLFDVLDAWVTPDAFERIVSEFREAGMHEFVVFWPADDQWALFERVATKVLPALRRG